MQGDPVTDGANPPPPEGRRKGGSPPRRPRAERTLTASEAAALIGVSIATVRGWADAGLLPSHRTVGGHRRFDPGELREWLRARGAPATARSREPMAGAPGLPPCPVMAHHLNDRTDAVVARVADGYRPGVDTPYRERDAQMLARSATRFVRSVAGALESGSPQMFAGRLELAGVRGALQPDGGAVTVALHARFTAAVVCEAQLIREEHDDVEEDAIACLLAVIDHACAALTRGLGAGPPRMG